MKNRFFEVVFFLTGILGSTALFVAIAFIPFFYMAVSLEDTIILTLACALIVAIIFGAIWILNYIILGEKLSIYEILNLVFGRVPKYFLFIGTAITLGGIIAAAYHGKSDEALWWNDFFGGVGATLGILTIGLIGRLYGRNRFLGHVIATIIIAILCIPAYQYTNSIKTADRSLSKYYTNDMYSVLAMDLSDHPDVRSQLLRNPEFLDAVVATHECETRTDLSPFVSDVMNISYGELVQRYGNDVADNRHLIQTAIERRYFEKTVVEQ